MSILKELKKPFPLNQIKVRPGGGGTLLAYLDARTVMRRLDQVCGIHWQTRYPYEGCCEIGIAIADATGKTEWIWKSNGAGETNIEGEKGQYSDAFKRAAVLWGVGRYLYEMKVISFDQKTKHPTEVSKWAMPENYDEYLDVWDKL